MLLLPSYNLANDYARVKSLDTAFKMQELFGGVYKNAGYESMH